MGAVLRSPSVELCCLNLSIFLLLLLHCNHTCVSCLEQPTPQHVYLAPPPSSPSPFDWLQVWALDVNASDTAMVTGAADGALVVWRDDTKEKEDSARKEEEERVSPLAIRFHDIRCIGG